MLHATLHASIEEIDATCWDALAASANPFTRHAFLASMERTGCIRAQFGWQPNHFALRDGERVIAALPLYVKANSHGEFVFDWTWADAWERAGGDYYPKLLCGVPYSPVPGPRLLAGNDPDAPTYRRALAAALLEQTRRAGMSSAHVDFCNATDNAAFADSDWLARSDWQFHWHNADGWRDFHDFMDAFTHKRRKEVRRERAEVAAAGVECEWRDGDTLTDAEVCEVHRLYRHTFDSKGNTPTLTLDFFRELASGSAGHMHVALARRAGRIIAMAMFIAGDDTLYGRYWGAYEQVPALHFDLCYYQGIDYCLRAGLHAFQPGAQGVHKLARGFLPARTYSWHYLADPALRNAVRDWIARDERATAARGTMLATHSPFAQRGAER